MLKSVVKASLVGVALGACTVADTTALNSALQAMAGCAMDAKSACECYKKGLQNLPECTKDAMYAPQLTDYQTLLSNCVAGGETPVIPGLPTDGVIPGAGDMMKKICDSLDMFDDVMKCGTAMLETSLTPKCMSAVDLLEADKMSDITKTISGLAGGMGGGAMPGMPSGADGAPSMEDGLKMLKDMCKSQASGRRLLSEVQESQREVLAALSNDVMKQARRVLLVDDKVDEGPTSGGDKDKADKMPSDEMMDGMCKSDCFSKVLSGLKQTMKCLSPIMDKMGGLMGDDAKKDKMPDPANLDKMMDMSKMMVGLYCAKNFQGKHCGVVVNPAALNKKIALATDKDKCGVVKALGCCFGNFNEANKLMDDMAALEGETVNDEDKIKLPTDCVYNPLPCLGGGDKQEVGEVAFEIPGLTKDKIDALSDLKLDVLKAAVMDDFAALTGFDLSKVELKELKFDAEGKCKIIAAVRDNAEDIKAKATELAAKIKAGAGLTKTTEAAIESGVISSTEKLTSSDAAATSATVTGASVDTTVEDTPEESGSAAMGPTLAVAGLATLALAY